MNVARRSLILKMEPGDLPGHLQFNDFYNIPGELGDRLRHLLQTRTLVYGSKGKLKPVLRGYDSVNPWWYAKVFTDRDCVKLKDLYFEHFGIIPSRCLRCWKTVVVTNPNPEKQKVSALFKLRDILHKTGFPCKCGVDVRKYTPNRYSGFIYGDSLEQAFNYRAIIERCVRRYFPRATANVKRGCTEFEDKFTNPDEWDKLSFRPTEDYLEAIIETYDVPSIEGFQAHQATETFRFWIEYAHGIGDLSWREALKSQGYEPPESLFHKPKFYYEE